LQSLRVNLHITDVVTFEAEQKSEKTEQEQEQKLEETDQKLETTEEERGKMEQEDVVKDGKTDGAED
jgi:hypothetical protein